MGILSLCQAWKTSLEYTVWDKKSYIFPTGALSIPYVSNPLHRKVLCGNCWPLLELPPKANSCSSMGHKPPVLLTSMGPEVGLEGLVSPTLGPAWGCATLTNGQAQDA